MKLNQPRSVPKLHHDNNAAVITQNTAKIWRINLLEGGGHIM